MRVETFLLCSVLLVLTKSALGIEVEPNDDSAHANALGQENFGQLKKKNDVDFFSIDTKTKGDSDISLSFSCDSHANSLTGLGIGWNVGIYNPKGEEQATYQISPDECVTGTSGSKGPYSFKFYSDKLFSTYYLAVVGDCEASVTFDTTNIANGTSCNKRNTATYSIKYDIAKTPYLASEITKNAINLATENVGQIKTENAFKFYSFDATKTDIPLEFSCHKNTAASAGVDTSGWVVSIWSMGADGNLNSEVDANYEIAPQDCTPNETDTSTYTYTTTTATGTVVDTSTTTSTTPVYSWTPTGPYKISIPKPCDSTIDKQCNPAKTYYVGVQTNCLTKPENTTSIPVLKNRITGIMSLDCAVNTSPFTIKKAEGGESIEDLINTIKNNPKDKFENHNLGESKKDEHISSSTEIKLYYVDSGDSKNEVPLILSCDDKTTRFTNNWKLNIYNGVNVLQSSRYVNGSDCATGHQGDSGPLKFNLPSGSSRYYLTLKSACAANDKSCVVETSPFTISRDKLNLTAGVAVAKPYANIASSSKLATLELTKKGQITSVKDFRFYAVDREITTDDISLNFECPKNSNSNGWVVSVWDHDKLNKANDTLQNVYSISSDKCSAVDTTTSATGVSSKTTIPFQIPLPPTLIDKSYYIGVQTSCLTPIPLDADNSFTPLMTAEPGYTYLPCVVNTDTFTLKLPETSQKLDSKRLSLSNNLGNDKSGQINSIDDNDIYGVESDGTADISLIFSCSPMAMRQTNDWTLSVYNSTNELVSSQFVNGSDCGSGFVGDKGGYPIILPKGSPSYYLSVKSACTLLSKKGCVVDTAEYNISRGATKVYTGKLTAKTLTAKSAKLTLANCGLNSGATIAVEATGIDFSKTMKNKTLPVKIQIGSMACQILTSDKSISTSNAILGNLISSEIIDSSLIAKDSATITVADCGSDKASVTVTGLKLDLENLNSDASVVTTATTTTTPVSSSVAIPIKVDIGDFHCEGRDAFSIDTDTPKLGDKTYKIEVVAPLSTPGGSTGTPFVKPEPKPSTTTAPCYSDCGDNEPHSPAFGAK